ALRPRGTQPPADDGSRRGIPSPADGGRSRSTRPPTAGGPRRGTPSPPDGGELPRRVRQSHLVPQLREGAGPTGDPEPRSVEPPERTPEQVRDRMTAYRDGWVRGGGAAPGRPDPGIAHHDTYASGSATSGTPNPGTEGDRA
ncbi:hypothetical protein ACWF94_36590, partial [Streptomyces sp. NPDC055078]